MHAPHRGRRKRPSLLELDSVLSKHLGPSLTALENKRRHVWLGILPGLAVGLPLAFLLFKIKAPADMILQLSAGAGIGLGSWLFLRARRAYQTDFKKLVMHPVAKHFFPDLSYHPLQQVGQELYEMSELFRKDLSSYTGNDYFRGRLGAVDFEFSELHCQYTSGSGKNRSTHTAFRGFFFVGDFHRDFYFRTTIQPDQAESLLGVVGRGLQRLGAGGRLVDLEDPEFEKLFVTTSDDQVEARYILTPVFMEKLTAFRRAVGANIHLCFANSRMFLAIEADHDYFEPALLGSVFRRQDLMKFIDMLGLLIGVAEEFLHHPKFAASPPPMPHGPLPSKPITPPPPPPGWKMRR